MTGFFLKRLFSFFFCASLILFFGGGVFAQNEKLFLGVKLRPEVQSIISEIEGKTKRKIYAEYAELEEHTLGVSYIGAGGTPIVRVSFDLQNQPRKVEAVVAHELLHLRLRANGYPVFLFSPAVKTRGGRAQDVEQSNVNDLASLIEHRIFKVEMEKFDLNEIINLAGDTERGALQRKGGADGQADALNFARAVLEYPNKADVEKLRKIYAANKWHRSLKIGQEIADTINRARLDSPAAVASVFKICASKLYPAPRPIKLTIDSSVKFYKQFLIGY
jgi:hypothetical protein